MASSARIGVVGGTGAVGTVTLGLLREHGFDDFAEAQCATFYADTMGRPGLPPGIYFRLLLIGYFTWVLHCLSTAGLVKGKTIGIDATTLEANAALRSIVRRDSGESYEEFLTTLAKASGIVFVSAVVAVPVLLGVLVGKYSAEATSMRHR